MFWNFFDFSDAISILPTLRARRRVLLAGNIHMCHVQKMIFHLKEGFSTPHSIDIQTSQDARYLQIMVGNPGKQRIGFLSSSKMEEMECWKCWESLPFSRKRYNSLPSGMGENHRPQKTNSAKKHKTKTRKGQSSNKVDHEKYFRKVTEKILESILKKESTDVRSNPQSQNGYDKRCYK